MSFILRAAFWLTVLAFLLPTAGYQTTATSEKGNGAIPASYVDSSLAAPANDVNAREMLSLAAQSAGDVLGFCDRNPQVCSRGHAIVAHVVHQGSYYGAQAFLWLTEKARQTQKPGPEQIERDRTPRPLEKTYLAGV